LPAANRSGVLSIDVDLNIARRQLADDIEQTARRKRGRASFLNLRLKTSAYANVQIGRRQMDFAAIGLQKHVRQNRERGSGANDILDLLQTFEQFFFRYAEFHRKSGA